MKKRSLSFRAVCSGSYLHRFFLGDKSRRLHKAAIGVAALVCISTGASAQCNTFRNADEANPLRSVLDTTKTIAGFAFADIDGDGDQDVYVDYLGAPEQYGDILHLYRNTGTKTHPVFKEDTNTGFGRQHAGGQNGEMQFVDIDGDGDLDYFASDSVSYYYHNTSYVYYYKNIGTSKLPKFIPANEDFLPLYGTRYIQPFAFADVDGDGDYDLYASDAGFYLPFAYNQRVYFNTGSPQHPVFTEEPVAIEEDDAALYHTYYDWNKDGLLDFFVADDIFEYGIYYENKGPKNQPQYIYNAADRPNFKKALPYRMIDLNNDDAPEVFDFGAHYFTLTPVAVIKDSVLQNGNTALYSSGRNSAYNYRWELNGKTIAGATKYYIIPKQPGTYTLYVSDACGTGVSQDYEWKNTTPLLLADEKITVAEENMVGIRAYPNPFVNSITLQLPGKPCTVVITDMAGRILTTQNTSASAVHVGEKLTAGTYLVEVWHSGQSIYKTKVVKQ